MRAPAVSGASSYTTLCIAAKTEEQRLAELRKHQQYHSPPKPPTQANLHKKPQSSTNATTTKSSSKPTEQRCYVCGNPDHLAKDCPQKKSESKGKLPSKTSRSVVHPGSTRQVKSKKNEKSSGQAVQNNPVDFLVSDSEGEESDVNLIQVSDCGSEPKGANVLL